MSRIENLRELISATSEFVPSPDQESMSVLSAFLSEVVLDAGEQQADEQTASVSLMTLHAAKGLEFPVVFMVGMEEQLFPHQMSISERDGLEEERRLCYVGMTRAMNKLYLCHAESRRLYGQEKFHKASRFLRELPAECTEEIRLQNQVKRPST